MKLIESITASSWVSGFKHVTCARPDCSRWLTQRHLESRKVGVSFDNDWYCSYRCLANVLDSHLTKMVRQARPSGKRSFRMPLGLTLVSRGQLTEEQLRAANTKQKEDGQEMSEVLLDLGYVTEKQVTAVRAAQWSCPVFDVPEIIPPVAFRVPMNVMTEYRLVPLHYSERMKMLSIGFVTGIAYSALYALEQMAGCKAQPFLITASDYNRFLTAFPEPGLEQERVFDEILSPLEIRHHLCTLGARMDAEELSLARYADRLWARLKRGSVCSDVLFRVT